MKVQVGVGFWILANFITASVAGKSCPGFCTKDLENCISNNGKIVGYCQNEMACCDVVAGVTGTCGSAYKRLNTTYFKSPNFPLNSSGDLNCEFKLKLVEDSIGIRLDFLQFESDGLSYGQGKGCDSDMFFVRGFQTWSPPPRCGVLTGYSTIIDRDGGGTQTKELKTMSLLALMSSPSYLWHIKVTQLYPTATEHDKNASPTVRLLTEPKSNTQESHEKLSIPVVLHEEESNNEGDVEFDTKQNLNAKLSSIINGVDTEIRDVPWQASLRLVYTSAHAPAERIQEAVGPNCSITEGLHFCGGSIVGSQHILTAAHCFFGSSKSEGMTDLSVAKVILGDTNKCKDGGETMRRYNSSQYDIQTVTFHYAYDGNTIDNDVAVVKLKQKIEFKENVKAIRMADNGTDYTGQPALVSGWGMTELGEGGSTPDILQSAKEFTIENLTACHAVLEQNLGGSPEVVKAHDKYEHVYEGVFCTTESNLRDKGAFTGQGDSGGGLLVFCNETGEFLQLGVVSYALTYKSNTTTQTLAENQTCTTKEDEELDFFQSVPYYRPWINLALQG